MNTTRRSLLLSGLLGTGWLGLRALATGLPASFLLRADSARADELPACADASKAQFLILSVSGDGDPINANAPGTYQDPGIVHPDVAMAPLMAPAVLKLGQVETTAAKSWSTLPQWVLDRTSFCHMATMTTIHPDIPKVLQLMGDTTGQEMLPSLISRYLSGCLGTVQAAPASLMGTTRPEYITYGGNVIPNLNPIALRDILVHPAGPLNQLTQLRDKSMDKLHARLKAAGSASLAQRAFVDSLAKSRNETRAISDTLVNNLNAIKDNDAPGQIIGAVALIAMNVTPVVVIRIPFGGDNHADFDLLKESTETESGVTHIKTLMGTLQQYQLQDRVTFATLNVFGRTLKQIGTKGRNHWADHHVSLMIGRPIRGGVVGGIAPGSSQDYTALPIDSQSGAGTKGGDIPLNQTLSAFGKTLGSAVGLPQNVLEQNIGKGKVVPAALALLTAFLLTACSGSEPESVGLDAGTGEVRVELLCDGGPAPKFDELHEQIIASSCASCHNEGAQGTAPDMSTPELAFASIRDVLSSRYAGATGTLKIVDPGAPQNSTMMLKVLGGASKGFVGPKGEAVGGIMPQVGTLSTTQKDAIRNWICAGANP